MGLNKLIRKIATGSSESQSLCLVQNNTEQVVKITRQLDEVTVIHNGALTVINREQDSDAKIPALFAKTSRPCPPFCVQPMSVAPNVETIGELELLDCLQQSNDRSSVVVDSRIESWVGKGTIPGSINIPWTSLTTSNGATFQQQTRILRRYFSVKVKKGMNGVDAESLDFSGAKTVTLFCNGPWCGQTSESIKALLELGYPADKIKYYREGMQGWVSLGFTVVIDDNLCPIKTN